MTKLPESWYREVPVEELTPGVSVLTTNGDSRWVSHVKQLKHPDWFRVCFHGYSVAWERKRGQTVRVAT